MFKDFKEDTKTNVRATWNVAWWVTILGLIVLVCAIGGLALTPTFRNLWIKMFRSSNQYVTTKQTLLFELYDEYYRLDSKIVEISTDESNQGLVDALRGQQMSIVKRIDNEASLLHPDQVPQTIREFLREKGYRP